MSTTKLQKKLDEILNSERHEFRVYYDREKNETEVCYWIEEIEDRLKKQAVIIFPTNDELYPYGVAMGHFLSANGIIIPRGYSAIGYLAECGMKHEFYNYRKQEIKRRLLNWLESENIPIEII